jgi:PHD/YefM family antitoxin component YafN of YafNO toxin-antitoxin module
MTIPERQTITDANGNPAFVQLPATEYQRLQEELALLKDTALLEKFNRLIDLLYQDKYGLYMGDYTDDLREYAVNSAWNHEQSGWDNV